MADSRPSVDGKTARGGFPIEEFGVMLFREQKRVIVGLAVVGLVLGAAVGLLSPRQYATSATFIPQSAENSMSNLALAASQFGIRVPQSGGAWGPPVYVELLRSRELLEPIVRDTVAVPELGGDLHAMLDLLRLPQLAPAERIERGIAVLRKRIGVSEEKKLNGVRVSVTTRWPSVSLYLAERLVDGVNEFNVSARKSQATAERQFVDARVQSAEEDLRSSESRLEEFLKRNRSVAGSPELTFAQDRLQREVMLRQGMVTTLLQQREEARIREVRDTPVLTVLERPRLPVYGLARRSAMKGVLGAMVAMLIGIAVLYLREGLRLARRMPGDPEFAFFRFVDAILPGPLQRVMR